MGVLEARAVFGLSPTPSVRDVEGGAGVGGGDKERDPRWKASERLASASFRRLIVPSCTAELCSISWAPFGVRQRGGSRLSFRTTEEPRGWDKADVVEWARGGGGSAIPTAPGLRQASQTQGFKFVWVPWERFIILFFMLGASQ